MKNKIDRLQAIKEIVINKQVGSQEELIRELVQKGFKLTQATLSRDLKQLQIAKVAGSNGGYLYVLPEIAGIGKIAQAKMNREYTPAVSPSGFISIEFSGQLAVIKTRPGYASGLAYDIDSRAPHEVLGTIAGDDTILLVVREGVSRQEARAALTAFITMD